MYNSIYNMIKQALDS